MDDDMEAVDIVFAQRMASGEPTIRKRALKLLREHIKEESSKKALTAESLGRLCKGLHYALWMQDKMLLQEELVDNICALTQLFQSEDQVLEFAGSLARCLSKEWPNIDRWRMDKFLMLVRRLVRTLLARLANRQWDSTQCELYIQFFRSTFMSPSSAAHSSAASISESLKFHCTSLWLDELDNAGKMDKQVCIKFLAPYIELLKENISDTFFRSICTDIFDTILHDFSEQIAAKGSEEEEEEAEGEGDGPVNPVDANVGETQTTPSPLEFDYGKIAELLFSVGKHPNTSAKRRKRIYELCKKFENCARGVDPYPPIEGIAQKKRGRRQPKQRRGRENDDGMI